MCAEWDPYGAAPARYPMTEEYIIGCAVDDLQFDRDHMLLVSYERSHVTRVRVQMF